MRAIKIVLSAILITACTATSVMAETVLQPWQSGGDEDGCLMLNSVLHENRKALSMVVLYIKKKEGELAALDFVPLRQIQVAFLLDQAGLYDKSNALMSSASLDREQLIYSELQVEGKNLPYFYMMPRVVGLFMDALIKGEDITVSIAGRQGQRNVYDVPLHRFEAAYDEFSDCIDTP